MFYSEAAGGPTGKWSHRDGCLCCPRPQQVQRVSARGLQRAFLRYRGAFPFGAAEGLWSSQAPSCGGFHGNQKGLLSCLPKVRNPWPITSLLPLMICPLMGRTRDKDLLKKEIVLPQHTCSLYVASFPVSTANLFFACWNKKKSWQWRLGTRLARMQFKYALSKVGV